MKISLFILLSFFIYGGVGYINPTFTPIHLEAASTSIISVRIGAISDNGDMTVETRTVVKGKDAGITALSGDPVHNNYRVLKDMVGAGADALLFFGEFSNQGNDAKKVSALALIGYRWFVISGDGATRDIAKENDDFESTWNGSALMLSRALRYLQDDPQRARFPASTPAKWSKAVGPIALGAQVSRLLPIAGADGTSDSVLGFSSSGDRLVSGTTVKTLATASINGLLIDMDGDGLADLLSWNGKQLAALMRTKTGFADAPTSLGKVGELGGITGLAVWRTGAAASVVVGTASGASLLAKSETGWTMTPLAAFPEKFTRGGPVAVMDIDGDGHPDVLQICAEGIVCWRGGAAEQLGKAEIAYAGMMIDKPSQVVVTDHDQDGLPDLALIGIDRANLMRNTGDGRLTPSLSEAGEASAKSSGAYTSIFAGDFDHDGRSDLALGSKDSWPKLFFNRGFNSFGTYMAEQTIASETGAAPEFTAAYVAGSTAMLFEDLNRDGAPEMMFATERGELWRVDSLTEGTGAPTLTITAPTTWTKPTLVRAYEGKRSLGCRWLVPGDSVTFSLENKGPLKLDWFRQDGKPASKTQPVLKPATLVLP